MSRPQIVIVSPAQASANNGNWQTAWRWQQLLQTQFDCTIVQEWQGEACDVMLALHARRSAKSIARWANAKQGHARTDPSSSVGIDSAEPIRGLAVVLTGTDLYRDIQFDAAAQTSLRLAECLVVLQEAAPQSLPPALRGKTRVIFQSVPRRSPKVKPAAPLRAVMVGHLREEKSPETLFQAARLLANQTQIEIVHIGAALDSALGEQAQACAAACPQYRWLGGVEHDQVIQRIGEAHVLVHASRMEGGAHVIMEAVCSGTPVLASQIEGNVGMLGSDYAGYFPWGDAQALAELLQRCAGELRSGADGLYQQLQQQCEQRVPLFDPERERVALVQLVQELLDR